MQEEFDPIAYINTPRWLESRYGLERITELLNRMGRPQDRLRFVHVAGTNGKGSTCAYVASVLQGAGYRTGLFTSPYIFEFQERIRVDGANIALDDLRDVTLFVRDHAEAMEREFGEHPTEFELMTAVAFEHFARSGCEIVVCEVGMGGLLDSTNVIENPDVCAIVCIGLDHTEYLGSTLAEIATTKAGIIKPGATVVAYPQDDPSADEAIRAKAAECGCIVAAPDFTHLAIGGIDADGMRVFSYDGLSCRTRLLGSYQPLNAAMAIEILCALRSHGWSISDEQIVRGIADTSWPGRFEVVEARNGCRAVVFDGGHNPQGAIVLAESLADVFPDKRIVFLMSVLADKDYHAMIRAVAPLGAAWVCVDSPHYGRALDGTSLSVAVREETAALGLDPTIQVADSFAEGITAAKELAGSDGVVCAWGSLYSLADLKATLGR